MGVFEAVVQITKETFSKLGPIVFRRALVLLGDEREAEDATQEVFIKAMTQSRRFRGDSQVSTWLYRVTTNYCLNLLRDRRNRARLLDERVRPAVAIPGTPPMSTMMTIRRLVAEADERQARAAIYVYVDGMRREEVAKILGCSVRTVGNLLTEFNRWARARLGEEGEALAAEMGASRV